MIAVNGLGVADDGGHVDIVGVGDIHGSVDGDGSGVELRIVLDGERDVLDGGASDIHSGGVEGGSRGKGDVLEDVQVSEGIQLRGATVDGLGQGGVVVVGDPGLDGLVVDRGDGKVDGVVRLDGSGGDDDVSVSGCTESVFILVVHGKDVSDDVQGAGDGHVRLTDAEIGLGLEVGDDDPAGGDSDCGGVVVLAVERREGSGEVHLVDRDPVLLTSHVLIWGVLGDVRSLDVRECDAVGNCP